MPNQKISFSTQQVEMIHIDVEGDGKQIIDRLATDQDRANYAAQYAQFNSGGGPQQTTVRPTQAPQGVQSGAAQGVGAQTQPGANQTTDQASQQTQAQRQETGAPGAGR